MIAAKREGMMRGVLAWAAAAAALGLCCPVVALGDQAPPASLSPQAADPLYPLARYYPDRAQRLGKSGKVVLNCEITDQGGARDCEVVSEDLWTSASATRPWRWSPC